MALVTCHECKQQISSEAIACPQCGAKPKKGIGVGTIIVLAVVGWAAYTCAGTSERRTTASQTAAPSAPTKTQRELDIENYQAAFALDPKAGREYLAGRLQGFCEKQDAHLNYIKTNTRPAGRSFGLYCVHDFYTKYSLSSGSRAPALSTWIAENRALLEKNNVSRVGVWGTGAYATGVWFEVR